MYTNLALIILIITTRKHLSSFKFILLLLSYCIRIFLSVTLITNKQNKELCDKNKLNIFKFIAFNSFCLFQIFSYPPPPIRISNHTRHLTVSERQFHHRTITNLDNFPTEPSVWLNFKNPLHHPSST